MMKRILLHLLLLLSFPIFAQKITPTEKVVYKQVDDVKLSLHVFKPENHDKSKAAIVLIHGGGWNTGKPGFFYKQAKHFMDRGLVVICPEYRVRKRNNTTIYEAVEDTQEAVAYIRKHASDFGISKNKIAVGGGSAGGHLATSLTFIEPLSSSISMKDYHPDLLILLNPVLDIGKKGYSHSLVKKELEAKNINLVSFDPLQNVNSKLPTTLVMLGDKDNIVSVEVVEEFELNAQKEKVDVKTIVYKGAEHSFFNYGYGTKQGYPKGTICKWYFDTLQASDDFLVEHKFLSEKTMIAVPSKAVYPIKQSK